MQESRRRRRLELGLLPLSAFLAACASQAVPIAEAPQPRPVASSSVVPAAKSGPRTPSPVARSPQVGAVLSPPASSAPSAASSESAARESTPALPRGTVVLHVGDSFAGALGVPLGKRLKAAGLRSVLKFKTSSYIPTWAYGEELSRYVSNYNPDLVLVTLGANEFEIPDPNQRVTAIRRLIGKIGQRPCIWISPPRWKADTGLLEVIRANAAPCRFLDSDTLVRELPRARDQIHPSEEGREIWADAVFTWLGRAREPAAEKPWALRDQATASAATSP